ncbi:hypothetical protein ACFT9I_15180 [Streptomyces sp. NPDC057137]|uniref:hypothetical protein n=1 Tax=Streptomyces sp. NPDC057137 TaxID=3346030 RepID=UPI00362BEE34
MNPLNPLIYGYVRALPGLSNQDIDRLRADIAAFAHHQGFAPPHVFTEHTWTRVSAWEALVTACRWTRTRNVVVPSWQHLNTQHSLSAAAQQTLQDAIRGQVWFASAVIRTGEAS